MKTDDNGFVYRHVRDVMDANKTIGHYFFSPDTMKFFDSHVPTQEVFHGRYFITSERFDKDSPRLYTIREAKPNGDIATVDEFQKFETLEAAVNAAKGLS